MENEVVPTIAVIIYSEDKKSVLLIKHGEKASQKTGVFSLVGGKLDPGETHIQAALRELEEETGLVASADDLIEIPVDYSAVIERKDETKHYSMKAYVLPKYKGEIRSEGDKTTPEWHEITELDKLENLLPNIKEAVAEGRRSVVK